MFKCLALSALQIKHPTDPSLVAEAVMPVMPDFDCWENSYVQMQFDFDPGLEHAQADSFKFSRKRIAQVGRQPLVRGPCMHADKYPQSKGDAIDEL